MNQFSYVSGPSHHRRHTSFRVSGGRVKITCDSPAVECHHDLMKSAFAEFIAFLGVECETDPIAAASVAAAEGKDDLIYEAIHKFAKTTFSWLDFGD